MNKRSTNKAPKLKQTSMKSFLNSSLNKLEGYNVIPGDWITKKPKKSNGLKLVKSDSFEKYGTLCPSVEEIVKNINRVKEDRKVLDAYDKMCRETKISIPNLFQSTTHQNYSSSEEINADLLDCKHMSRKELKKCVKTNLDYLKDIMSGITFSKRHETYQDLTMRSKLTYNISTIVFTEEQKEFLMERLEKYLDHNNEKTEYLFMVLLPELCLKIFMDTHAMTQEEAVDYLNWRPVD